MDIVTSRFGRLSLDDDQIVTFPKGLIGFPNHARFTILPDRQAADFSWLQSIDDPDLAFLVADPGNFFKDYLVPIREETEQDLQITAPEQAQILVICNRAGEWLTGNLLGPIVLHTGNRLAQQVVLTEKKWTTRQHLVKLTTELPLARAA